MPISDKEIDDLLERLMNAEDEAAKKFRRNLGIGSMSRKKRTTKHVNRILRVLRLLAVVKAYHHYTVMQMSRELLGIENSWKDAEHLSDWMNALIPCKEFSPTDFIHDKDEVTNEVLDNYEWFKKWVEIAASMGISEKTLTAFCKNVDNLQSIFRLKVLGHIYYPEWLMALFLYLNHAISKKELQDAFVEYSFFSGKPKPTNIAVFRKTILEIEDVIAQIASKQTNRENQNLKNNQ